LLWESHDRSPRFGAPPAQGPCGLVWEPVHVRGDLQDARAGGIAHAGSAVQRERHRAFRHTGTSRDVLDGGSGQGTYPSFGNVLTAWSVLIILRARLNRFI
jgi:hypothetical protein